MIERSSRPRFALAHDWLVGMRGGERVLDRLARQFGPAPLYTMVSDGRSLSEAIDACRIVTSPLQRFPGASGRWRRHYLPLMPWAVDQLRVEACDLLISTSSALMKSIRPPEGTPHLCYCHSPARYLWEQGEDYAVGSGGRLRALGLGVFGDRLRRWDRATASRVTRFVANSAHTAARIQRCFDRGADVVHPPVRTSYFTPRVETPREDWFLVVAALEPYKRTDLVVEAARRGGFSLKVVGGGSQAEAIARQGGDRVEVLGRVDDEALRALYRRARALVFPQLEDFGIIAVEAAATGCPVLAFRGGGAEETVRDGETGLFFDTQDVDAIVDAVERLRQAAIDPIACRAHAERFSEAEFDRAIARIVDEMLG